MNRHLSAEAIRFGIRRVKASEYASAPSLHEYRADCGRVFRIREFEQPQTPFFLEELRPNGRRRMTETDGSVREDARIATLAENPNAFFAGLEAIGVSSDVVVFEGGALGRDVRFFPTLRACADAIHAALEGNRWYDHVDRERANDPLVQARHALNDKVAMGVWRERELRIRRRSLSTSGLFRGLYDLFGPIGDNPTSRKRLLAFVNAARVDECAAHKAWEQAYGLDIGPGTLHQLWMRRDASAPRQAGPDGWERVPDEKTVMAILEDVRKDTEEKVRRAARAMPESGPQP